MPTITVKRGNDPLREHVLNKEGAYTLDQLRQELTDDKIMSPNDTFLSKSGAIISQSAEAKQYLTDLFEGDKRQVNIQVVVQSDKNIMITRAGDSSTTIVFNVDEKLNTLRTYLTKQVGIMTDEDQFAKSAENRIPKGEENSMQVKAALADKDGLMLVSGTPSRSISVVKGDVKKSYRVKDETTLKEFRLTLQNDKVMTASDLFSVDTGDLSTAAEAETKIKDLKGNTLTIKYDSVVGGTTVPKPTLPSIPDPKVDWSQNIAYTQAGGAMPPPKIDKGTFDGKDQDDWMNLSTEQRRYVYNKLQLGRAIIIGPRAAIRASKKTEITRSFRDSVVLLFPDAGPRALPVEVGLRSRFVSTFSLEFHELHRKALSTATASAGVKGAAFTSEVNVASETAENTLKSRLYTSQRVRRPVIKLQTDIEKDVRPNPQFALAAWEAVTLAAARVHRYAKLLDVLTEFGHYLPTEFELGGAFILEETGIVDKSKKMEITSFSAKSGFEATIKGVEVGAGGGHSQSQQQAVESQYEERTSELLVIGGDPAAVGATDYSAWVQSLKKHTYWNVIQYAAFVPIIRFLQPPLLKACLSLLKEYAADPLTAGKTFLDMTAYAYLAETALPADELYD